MPVELPLLDQPARHSFPLRVTGRIQDAPALMPGRTPEPGEQYRFHFDMGKCIGCKCCVVACNEQNGNPASINWRQVGEIEGGVFPLAQHWHLSMSCNHCLEPACMIGCPVEAYSKDTATGIVDHDPDICIGCQYCTWNCSYGVPKFNPERGVVGKCDMCHGRLEREEMPACVNACPSEAISIEIVDQDEWRRYHRDAHAPGMPSPADTLSTTRITVPERLSSTVTRVDQDRIQPEHAHWSLVFLLVASQLSVGAMAVLWVLGLTGAALKSWAAIVPLAIAAVALAAAPLHLGRPIYAYRAIKNWRRSWLSREVLGLSLFAGSAAAYAAALFLRLPATSWLGAAAFATGVLGVTASARIYMVPARPSWNLPFTLSSFYLTCAVLGPRLVLATGLGHGGWLVALAIGASLLQYWNSLAGVIAMSRSPIRELRASATLLGRDLRRADIARMVCSALAIALVLVFPIPALLFSLAGEVLGRYLFFASVVPKSVASTYLAPKEAA